MAVQVGSKCSIAGCSVEVLHLARRSRALLQSAHQPFMYYKLSTPSTPPHASFDFIAAMLPSKGRRPDKSLVHS